MAEGTVSCELCASPAGESVWEDALCRVVRVADTDYPGFCRVIWNTHVAEMTDLPSAERRHLMTVVFAVEAALRSLYHPDKINLASFGNMVPHLHWHVVPRFRDDLHFPQAIFAAAQRAGGGHTRAAVSSSALHGAIVQALSEEHGGAS